MKLTIFALFVLLIVVTCGWWWVHTHNYSGVITEFRDIGDPPEGIVFSLDGAYPQEKMLLRIEAADIKKFFPSSGGDLLPQDHDYVHIKGPIHHYTGDDGIRHNIMVVSDPSQIVIESRSNAK